MMHKTICRLHMILVLHPFSNNHKGMKMMCFVKSSMSRPWRRFCGWIIVQWLHQLCCFVVVGWKMGITIEATPPINEMTHVFCLQIFVTYFMNLMNHLFFLHKFNQYFFRMSQSHHGGRLYLGGSPKVVELLQTPMMIALMHVMLCLGLKFHLSF
jgi:hypothetical protein